MSCCLGNTSSFAELGPGMAEAALDAVSLTGRQGATHRCQTPVASSNVGPSGTDRVGPFWGAPSRWQCLPCPPAWTLTPTKWPTATERPMDSAGEPTLPFLRLSVDAKMHAASWKVRMISTTRAWPGVVLLLSCEPPRMAIINHPQGLAALGGLFLVDLGWQSHACEAPAGLPMPREQGTELPAAQAHCSFLYKGRNSFPLFNSPKPSPSSLPEPLRSFESPMSPHLPLIAALRAFPPAHFVPFFLHYSPPCSLQATLSWLFPPLLCGAPPQEAGEQLLQRGRGGRVQAGGDNGARHGGKLGCCCPRASPASGDCVRWTQPHQAWEGQSDLSCGGFFFSFHLKVTGLGHVACGSKAPCSTSS